MATIPGLKLPNTPCGHALALSVSVEIFFVVQAASARPWKIYFFLGGVLVQYGGYLFYFIFFSTQQVLTIGFEGDNP